MGRCVVRARKLFSAAVLKNYADARVVRFVVGSDEFIYIQT